MEYPHDLVKITVYRSDRQRLKALAARRGELMHVTAGRAIAWAEAKQLERESQPEQLDAQIKGAK